jgi:hypothetical protein
LAVILALYLGRQPIFASAHALFKISRIRMAP